MMDRPYLQELWIRNYGCVRDVHVTFSPLHALIGPNDSGKTTILRAIQTASFLAQSTSNLSEVLRGLIVASARHGELAFDVASSSYTDTKLGITSSWHSEYREVQHTGAHTWRTYAIENGFRQWENAGRWASPGGTQMVTRISELLKCTLLRLDPDALRTPRQLLLDHQPIRFADERGLGLPSVYDAIQNRDIQSYLDLNTDIKKLFPDVKGVRLKNPSAGTKSIAITLLDGTEIEAEHISEGLLYYLAFAALRYIDRPALLLVEEPENGLHPARIAEVMRVLRELSKTTQIILATHSPLVINELEPHEVSVITRTREKGTQATLIKNTPNFEERSKVYALGELWLSYSNGIDEAPLLSGGPRS